MQISTETIKPIFNNMKRYLIDFIDYFSKKKTQVNFLVQKLEAFHNLKIYKSHVKKEIGAYIGGLCTDR